MLLGLGSFSDAGSAAYAAKWEYTFRISSLLVSSGWPSPAIGALSDCRALSSSSAASVFATGGGELGFFFGGDLELPSLVPGLGGLLAIGGTTDSIDSRCLR